MSKHLRRGLIVSLSIFILLMICGSIDVYLDPKPDDSNLPMYFSIQRYWLLVWSIISLVVSFIVVTLTMMFSSLVNFYRNSSRKIIKR
jgi:hypothetical protein